MPPRITSGDNWEELRTSDASEISEFRNISAVREFRIQRRVDDPSGIDDVTPNDVYGSAQPPLPYYGEPHPLANAYPSFTARNIRADWLVPGDKQFVLVTVTYATGLDNSPVDGNGGGRRVLWSTNSTTEATTVFTDDDGQLIEGGAPMLRPIVEYMATLPNEGHLTPLMEQTAGAVNATTFRRTYLPRSAMFMGAQSMLIRGSDTTQKFSSTVQLRFLCKRLPGGFHVEGPPIVFGGWDNIGPLKDEGGLPIPGRWDAQRLPYDEIDFSLLFPTGWIHGLTSVATVPGGTR